MNFFRFSGIASPHLSQPLFPSFIERCTEHRRSVVETVSRCAEEKRAVRRFGFFLHTDSGGDYIIVDQNSTTNPVVFSNIGCKIHHTICTKGGFMETRRKISLGFTDELFDEGHHIIYVYNDDNERKQTLARFLEEGYAEHEKLLYLVNDISPDEMRGELRSLGVDVEKMQKDFDLTGPHYSYCPDNYFSSNFMLDMVGGYYDRAIKEGYSGARGAGEMSWALIEGRATIPDLIDYEAKLNGILRNHPLTTVCQYDARRFDGAVIMDMLSCHPMMIVRGQLVKNPFFVEHEVFLREYRARHEHHAHAE